MNRYQILIYDEEDNIVAEGYADTWIGREAYWDVVTKLREKEFLQQPEFKYAYYIIKRDIDEKKECRVKVRRK